MLGGVINRDQRSFVLCHDSKTTEGSNVQLFLLWSSRDRATSIFGQCGNLKTIHYYDNSSIGNVRCARRGLEV